ncbi:MAG: hypothetical protein FD122_2674 [Stygiobacter sp.]|nr:MAG: hypothetical protein FD122_2674 [Stygiobacter sp.]KAF0215209.1 MAG: hypothetical protein FD178_1848 [Ignavibacteria bacterium]
MVLEMENEGIIHDSKLKDEIKILENYVNNLQDCKLMFSKNLVHTKDQLRYAPQDDPTIFSIRKFISDHHEQLITDEDYSDFAGMREILYEKDFFENFLIVDIQQRSLRFIHEELNKVENILESKKRELQLYYSAISKSQIKVRKQEREIVCDAMYELLKNDRRLDLYNDDLYKKICTATGKDFNNVKKTFTANMDNIRFEHRVKALWKERVMLLKNNKKINKLSRSKKNGKSS